ncbi:MAG: hypothetical protein H6625_13160 [Bdellovibrionaceae bacterium]|nr:hypothetical protein [Pseudobdellovibrionaceae bacterium]
MSVKLFVFIFIFSVVADSKSVSHLDQIMADMAKHAAEYNKKPNFENFVKHFAHPTDSDTLAYMKRKFADGEMRGLLSKIKIKNHEVIIDENTLKVLDLERRKYSLNGYDFQIKLNMSAKDRFDYIERILRSQKSSSWWSLLPKANAGFGDLVSGAMSSILGNTHSNNFGNSLSALNKSTKQSPYAVNNFTCNSNNMNLNLESGENHISITMMDLGISDEKKNEILNANTTNLLSELHKSKDSTFSVLFTTYQKNKETREENEKAIAIFKAGNHRITQSMAVGDVVYTKEGRMNVTDGTVNWDDEKYCIPDGFSLACSESELDNINKSELVNQVKALALFKTKLYVELVDKCIKKYSADVRTMALQESEINRCPDMLSAIKDHIQPYWKNLTKLEQEKEIIKTDQSRQLARSAYTCYLEEVRKNNKGCCQAIPEDHQAKNIKGYNKKTRKVD